MSHNNVSKGITEEQEGDVEKRPIVRPADIDVLFQRGSFTQYHPGNVNYRRIVKEHKADYALASKIMKPTIAGHVIETVTKTGARFLAKTQPKGDGYWVLASEDDVVEKVMQCLRQNQRLREKNKKRKAQEALLQQSIQVLREKNKKQKEQEALLQRTKAARSTSNPENTTRVRSDFPTASMRQPVGSLPPARSSAPSNFPGRTTMSSDVLPMSLAQHAVPPVFWPQPYATTLSSPSNLHPWATVAQQMPPLALLLSPPQLMVAAAATAQTDWNAALAASILSNSLSHNNTPTPSSLTQLQKNLIQAASSNAPIGARPVPAKAARPIPPVRKQPPSKKAPVAAPRKAACPIPPVRKQPPSKQAPKKAPIAAPRKAACPIPPVRVQPGRSLYHGTQEAPYAIDGDDDDTSEENSGSSQYDPQEEEYEAALLTADAVTMRTDPTKKAPPRLSMSPAGRVVGTTVAVQMAKDPAESPQAIVPPPRLPAFDTQRQLQRSIQQESPASTMDDDAPQEEISYNLQEEEEEAALLTAEAVTTRSSSHPNAPTMTAGLPLSRRGTTTVAAVDAPPTERPPQLQRYVQPQDVPSSLLLGSSSSSPSYSDSGELEQNPELFAGQSTATLNPIHRRQQQTFQQVLDNLRDDDL